jgi:chondroitin 4-sulfotransferase 11
MLSREHNCIFVHQRKCAGMAIIGAFGIELESPEFHFGNDGLLAPEWTEHPEVVARSFTFAVVRNPWDRFVSAWMYCRSTRQRTLADVLRRPPPRGHDHRHVTRSQTETIYRADDTLAVDHVIRYEHLDRGFAEVCGIIGLPALPLPLVNVGDRPHYHDAFDARTRKLFVRRYQRDIDLLGYSY